MTTETATIVVQGRWANEGGWFDIRKCETLEAAEDVVKAAKRRVEIRSWDYPVLLSRTLDGFRIITRRSVVTEAVLKEVEVTR